MAIHNGVAVRGCSRVHVRRGDPKEEQEPTVSPLQKRTVDTNLVRKRAQTTEIGRLFKQSAHRKWPRATADTQRAASVGERQ